MSLYVCVTGYTDAPGHTEYIITTDFEDTAGKRHSVSKMHRFSAFQDLHADIQLKLGLPTTLPVAKTLMTTSAVMGWWWVVVGVLGTFATFVGYFSLYSFGVASPARKVYATPMMKHEHAHAHAEREMRDLSSAQQQ